MPSSAEYQRQWRAKNKEAAAYNAACHLARSRALTRLAAAHPDEYDHLVNVERGLMGLPPLGMHGRPQYAPKRKRRGAPIDGSESEAEAKWRALSPDERRRRAQRRIDGLADDPFAAGFLVPGDQSDGSEGA